MGVILEALHLCIHKILSIYDLGVQDYQHATPPPVHPPPPPGQPPARETDGNPFPVPHAENGQRPVVHVAQLQRNSKKDKDGGRYF